MSERENEGLPQPNYTQVPNVILDNMAELSDAELRVMLAACRQIIGYHKTEPEPLTITWLEKKTGLGRPSVTKGKSQAIMRKWLVETDKRGKNGRKLYTLNFARGKGSLPLKNPQGLTKLTTRGKGSLPLDAQTSKVSEPHKRKRALKKSSKEKILAPSGADAKTEKPKNERPKDPLFEAIKDSWRISGGGMIGKIKKQVLGKIPKSEKHHASNVEPAMTPEEVREFALWYGLQCPGYDMPEAPEKIQKWVYKFRANGSAAEAPEPPPTPEQLARAKELANREKTGMDGKNARARYRSRRQIPQSKAS